MWNKLCNSFYGENIFYLLILVQMLFRKYLVDLIETLHIFLKLLCSYCKGKKMVIQKTATRRKKSSKNKSKSEYLSFFDFGKLKLVIIFFPLQTF